MALTNPLQSAISMAALYDVPQNLETAINHQQKRGIFQIQKFNALYLVYPDIDPGKSRFDRIRYSQVSDLM